ncbi:MAG TPA: alpha/beta-hydrolase N-terminal domain-containing protein, partial [Nocardioidaceae bacterium]|nr:alpha/beta-hydrolase N-terminal domain-containing protein [Nocardioidaceae bacterium]
MTTVSAAPASVASRLVARAPSVSASLLCTPAFGLSLLPSLLPRPALVQGVLSGLLIAIALGLSAPLARLERRLVP